MFNNRFRFGSHSAGGLHQSFAFLLGAGSILATAMALRVDGEN